MTNFPFVVTDFDGHVVSRHRSAAAAWRIDRRHERLAARTRTYSTRTAWEVERDYAIGDRLHHASYGGDAVGLAERMA